MDNNAVSDTLTIEYQPYLHFTVFYMIIYIIISHNPLVVNLYNVSMRNLITMCPESK